MQKCRKCVHFTYFFSLVDPTLDSCRSTRTIVHLRRERGRESRFRDCVRFLRSASPRSRAAERLRSTVGTDWVIKSLLPCGRLNPGTLVTRGCSHDALLCCITIQYDTRDRHDDSLDYSAILLQFEIFHVLILHLHLPFIPILTIVLLCIVCELMLLFIVFHALVRVSQSDYITRGTENLTYLG